MELETLAYWEADRTFQASLDQRAGAPSFVFNDGPPFANGMPHYGHLLTGYVKDAIPRYQTMRGMRVDRRFGWDCHGLPAETAAEKELGVSGRGPITAYGIDRFNEYCRTSVLRYVGEWQRYVTRQARWVDFANDYKTMDLDFMESVMWAFKTLHDRGLIYEAYRVLPYCWECETPLAISETRLDDAYRERVDPAVTVVPFGSRRRRWRRCAADGELNVLVWTTTPWTLPSNLALRRRSRRSTTPSPRPATVLYRRQGPPRGLRRRARRRRGRRDGTRRRARRSALPPAVSLLRRMHRMRLSSSSAAETSSRPTKAPASCTSRPALEKTTSCSARPTASPCSARSIRPGRFDETMGDLVGLQVFEANDDVIATLRANGAALRREEYTHSYPHCWRTETPLIYRAVSSFFVEVVAIKDRLLALNEEINWVPDHVKDGAFGKWLEGARDWSISRNRFWGTPIPVWKSDDPAYPRIDVYGSLDQIEADFGVRPTDLHRPAVDELVRPNPDDPTGLSMMRRVTDVLDCWFESGAMPFAQLHYPFENTAVFEERSPVDFICEYIGQARTWFYYQHVLSVALFDRPAFKNVIVHGIVLGDDGRKLSKRLRNFPDPEEFFAEHGADAMRWYLLSSPVLRGLDVVIENDAMRDPIRQVLNPIWNAWHFLSLYGGTDQVTGTIRTDATGILDRYILAKTRVLNAEVTDAFERYDLAGACGLVTRYLDALTNWYVRRSRERFWRPFGGDAASDADKRDAYDTLHSVLEVSAACCAPLLPLLTEEIYRGLTGRAEASTSPTGPKRTCCRPTTTSSSRWTSCARSVRRRTRSARPRDCAPACRSLSCASPARELAAARCPIVELIKEEVNVKNVELGEDSAALGTPVLQVVPGALGPRLGPRTQQVINAGAQPATGKRRRDGRSASSPVGIALEEGEYTLALRAADGDAARVLGDGVVALDVDVTPELAREGVARDIVRLVQQERKNAGPCRSPTASISSSALGELTSCQAHNSAPKIARRRLPRVPAFVAPQGDDDPRLMDGRAIAMRSLLGGRPAPRISSTRPTRT